ncbi:alginate export family protein [Lysobacter humi (ex Lee et al. 2017)]
MPTFPVRLLAACLAAAPLAAVAADAAPVSFEWNARLRHEHVDDAAFARDADATTLRIRAGLRWRIAPGWEALVEGEGVAAADDDYNSTANRRTAYPAVVDPEGVELNQAWLRWKSDRADATVGRQRILFDNQRWVGNVGWRQNEQTFDAVAVGVRPMKEIAVTYAFVDRVHRVNGDDAVDPLARERDLAGHLLNAAWARGEHRVAAYAYAVEDEEVRTASTRTLGLRYVLATKPGTRLVGLTAEAARQVDHADNLLGFSHAYWLVEPALALAQVTLRAGWEHLGGDGRHALQTPFATLHAFNGWADKFLVTPAAGLDDRYLAANGALLRGRGAGALEWSVAWHDYRADAGGARYGTEANAALSMPVRAGWRATAKVADYRADAFARDTRKWWLMLEWVSPAK